MLFHSHLTEWLKIRSCVIYCETSQKYNWVVCRVCDSGYFVCLLLSLMVFLFCVVFWFSHYLGNGKKSYEGCVLEHRGGRSIISFGGMWWVVQFSATLKGGVKPFYNRGLYTTWTVFHSWNLKYSDLKIKKHCLKQNCRKISSCWVNTTSRQGKKQLGVSFGSILLLFSI